MTEAEAKEICRVCKFPIETYDEGESKVCSEFCAQTSEKEKLDFLTLKPGEYGVWPCSENGCPTEGEYTPNECCASCTPKRDARVRRELLQEVLRIGISNLPPDLVERIQASLK